MKCKFCEAELKDNSSVCPKCGKDNLNDNLKGLKIVALVLTCVVMLVLLAGLVCYGVTGSFVPNWGANDETTVPSTNAAGTTSYVVTTFDGQKTMTAEEFTAAMDEVVATMGEYEMTNRQFQLYYWMCAYSYATNADFSKSLQEQVYDSETGETYHEYVADLAIDAWQETMLMCDQATKAGYVMDDEYTTYLGSMEEELAYYAIYYYGLSSADEMVQMQFGAGCNYDTYYEYAYNYYYGGLYWADQIEKFEVTEDEINTYFDENEESLANDYTLSITKDFGNLIDIRNIMIPVVTEKDEEGNTTEDWDATLTQAQEVYDLWVSGGADEASFISLVGEYSKDTGSNTAEGLYTDMYKGSMKEVDVRHILVKAADTSDEAWATALSKAEEILDEWLAGEATEDTFAELANTYSEDTGSNTKGGLYTDVYMGQMVKSFEDWCFDEHEHGDYGIVASSYGYHIMFFVRADDEIDNWVSDESRVAGDVAILKDDSGYQLIYYVTADPAWYRYSRYGAQTAKAEELLDGLKEENAVVLNEEAVVIGQIS